MFRETIQHLGPLRPWAKRSARFFFPRYSWLFDRLNWEARLATNVKEFPSAIELSCREDLFKYVSDSLPSGPNTAIDYLEHGDVEGISLRCISKLHQNCKTQT